LRLKLGKKKFKRHHPRCIGIWKIVNDDIENIEKPTEVQLNEMAKSLWEKFDRLNCRYRTKIYSHQLIYRPSFGTSPATIAIKAELIKDGTK
jgi:hypothetical protein